MQLVDEENDLAFGFGDFLQQGLQAVFEFAAVFRAGHQGRQVERNDALRLQNFGHVAGDDSLREPFDDGRLAHAGLANQHGIVLGAARQNLHHAANFFVAANHRIELSAARQFGEIARILFERAVGCFGILRGDAMAAADGRHGLQDGVVGGAVPREQLARGVAVGRGDRQQDMFGRDVFVLQALRFVEGALENVVRRLAEILFGNAGNLRQPLDLLFGLAGQRGRRHAQFFEQRRDHAVALSDQRPQKVQRLDLLLAGARSQSPALLAALPGPLPLVCRIVVPWLDFLTFL